MQKGLKETASLSFEAKAAIIGAMYALERLFAASSQRGTTLINLSSLIGINTKTLQQYEYAANQVGISNEEMDSTFKNLQSTFEKARLNEGGVEGLGQIARLTGDITSRDIEEWAKNPILAIKRAQEYVDKETDIPLRNHVLDSLGLSDNVKAGLLRHAFTDEKLAKAPTLSDGELANLDKARQSWTKIGAAIEMAIAHFNAAHGKKLAEQIESLVGPVLNLAEAFTKLAEKLQVFKVMGEVFKTWTEIIKTLTDVVDPKKDTSSDIANLRADLPSFSAMDETAKAGVTAWLKESFAMPRYPLSTGGTGGILDSIKDSSVGKGINSAIQRIHDNKARRREFVHGLFNTNSVTPNVPNQNQAPGATNTYNINQNLNFQHDGKDASKVGDTHKKAINNAFYQNSALSQGN